MEIIIRNPNQIEVLVPDNIKEIKDVLAIIMPIVLLLFFKIRFIPIAKHMTEAYDIAKALNNNPVGLSLIPIAKSRLFICATGIIPNICKNTNMIFIAE
jgi:hypothetical protein